MVNANISMNHMITTIKECRVYLKAIKIPTATKRILEILRNLKEGIGKLK